MDQRSFLLAPLALAALLFAPPAAAGGSRLPELELSDFGQTKAKSFEDFAGRTILIEFFAYW